ncbi:hypothetical protein RDWZM_008782 [Blomia tropicalis]|uniref:CB1 cannabinoid receptor-interacting protein 1 n=1 Tax=Blomia tropicalis TaxID=40697 RepID=A0A9Q0M592_BLOTA|nr:hypothetical protein RDWZM_008782 [Blomia tropicalis]
MSYTASLEIRRLKKDGLLDENAPKVCYKRDGQRFSCENTVKLLVDTNYEFQFSIRPPLPLHSVSVQGCSVTIEDLSNANANLNESNCNSPGSTYSFKWDTIKAEPDKRKKRSTLQLMLQFQGNQTLILPLQVKFYKLEDEDHLTWGQSLNRIDFECEQKPGMTCTLDVVKTIFH